MEFSFDANYVLVPINDFVGTPCVILIKMYVDEVQGMELYMEIIQFGWDAKAFAKMLAASIEKMQIIPMRIEIVNCKLSPTVFN